jgi:hypothetical protein
VRVVAQPRKYLVPIFEDAPNLLHTSFTQSNKPLSPLLRLPLRIRIRIYRHTLSQGTVQVFPQRWSENRSKPNMGLLFTCWQSYLEATSIFYGLNTFSVRHHVHLAKFTALLTPGILAVIRYLRLDIYVVRRVHRLAQTGEDQSELRAFSALEAVYVRGQSTDWERGSINLSFKITTGNMRLGVIWTSYEL